jgi:hypothetical protein
MSRKIKQEKYSSDKTAVIIGVCLVAAVIAFYWPVHKYQFVTYDDTEYVLGNDNIKTGLSAEAIRWAFTTGHTGNWHPLTWLSLACDYQLFKLNAGGYHVINVLFHIINTLLLFYLFKYLTGTIWPSAFIAAAFAIHPLHIESVAWISERKDVLSAMFWFLTMFAYAKFVKDKKMKWYIAALILFILGLMSKPMLVTLPFVLLLIDYWPLERKISPRLLVEKIPFFILSLISSIVTFSVQQKHGAMTVGESFGFITRIYNALVSYSVYIYKMFWPVKLAVLYPHPGDTMSNFQIILSVIVLAVICVGVFILRKHKFFTVGWLWYLGTLVPVIGIIQVGQQAYADRYTYIPLIGLFVMLAFGGKEFLSKRNRVCLATALLVLWSFIHLGVLGVWTNSETLYQNALRNTKNNHVILGNYILHLMGQQRYDQALGLSCVLLKIKPDSATAYINLGVSLVETGKFDEAERQFELALKYSPDSPDIYYNLAMLAERREEFDEAALYYGKTIKAEPNFVEAYIRLGTILTEQNKIDEAIKIYQVGLEILPDNSQLKEGLDIALKKNGTK